jgi:hypothetical protein
MRFGSSTPTTAISSCVSPARNVRVMSTACAAPMHDSSASSRMRGRQDAGMPALDRFGPPRFRECLPHRPGSPGSIDRFA